MKASSIGINVAMACLVFSLDAQAQYKAPSQYFPKNNTAPAPGAQPAAPRPPDRQAPTAPQPPKFKELPVNTQFYFLSDTNRTYAWTKISSSTAKNMKNGLTQTINGETPVAR